MLMELGRLVFDIDVKTVGENKKVVNNRIAISRSKTESTFLDIVAWDRNAEIIGEYFKKGFEILLEGELINVNKVKVLTPDIKKGDPDYNEFSYQTVSLLVNKVRYTHGNPKEYNLSGDQIPDFLKY